MKKDSPPRFVSDSVMNSRGLRKRNRFYLLLWAIYYAWAAAFAIRWAASPLAEAAFGPGLQNLLLAVNLASSIGVALIIRKEWFGKTARIGGALLLAGVSAFLLGQNAGIQLTAALLIAMALGVVNICVLLPFIFVLNNTEKLYAIVGSNILLGLSGLFGESAAGSFFANNQNILLSFSLLLIAFSSILFFPKYGLTGDADAQSITTPKFPLWIYRTIFFSCFFILLYQGLGKGLLNLAAADCSYPLWSYYYGGGLLGGVIYFGLFAFFRECLHLASNLALGFLLSGLLSNAFAVQEPVLSVMLAASLGAGNTIVMANVYYTLGVIGKKYNHLPYIRLSVLFLGICGGIAGIAANNLFHSAGPMASFIVPASVFTMVVMLLFLAISPLLAHYREQDWLADTTKMEIDNEQLYLFQKYGLSKRETDVCKLLLQGYTLRQISATLSLAYSTVNTYYTASYRKLGINSRTELLLLFKDYDVK